MDLDCISQLLRSLARHLTLPETCNNLYCSGLRAPRPHTVALGCGTARELMGSDEKEVPVHHKTAQKGPVMNQLVCCK